MFNFSSIRILLSSIVVLTVAGVPVQAASPIGQAPVSVHRLKYVIHPSVVTGLSTNEVGRRLAHYTADLNTVFARETVRRFVFDPTTDLQVADPSLIPRCSGSLSDASIAHREIAVCVSLASGARSSGGSGGGTPNPQKGRVFLNWTTVHAPQSLSKQLIANWSPVHDYVGAQIKTFLHEIQHTFGAGMGEYYNTSSAIDNTGTNPAANHDADDLLGIDSALWQLDPLNSSISANDAVDLGRSGLLSAFRFTLGTKGWVNTDWDAYPYGTLAGLNATRVRVVDPIGGASIPGASVSVWNVPASSLGYPASLLGTGTTDSMGVTTFDWRCNGGPWCFSSTQMLVLIKASAPGRNTQARWFSMHHAFEQYVAGRPFEIDVPLAVTDAQPAIVAITAPALATLGVPTTMTVNANDNQGVARVIVRVGGWNVCVFKAPPYTCRWTPLRTGANSVNVVALDVAGNRTYKSASVVVVAPTDQTSPTVQLSVPAVVAVGRASTVTVNGSDNVGIRSVQVLVGGRTLCTASALPASCDWSPKVVGYEVIEARVTDTAGNIATTATERRLVQADVEPPTITPGQLPSLKTGQPVTFSATAIDNVGVTDVTFMLQGGATLCIDTTVPYTCTWTPPLALNDQSVSVVVTARDASGNSSRFAWGLYVVPNEQVPPVISFNPPATAKVGVPVTLSASVTDASKILATVFLLDGQRLCKVQTAPWTCLWTPITPGRYTLEVQAFDSASNFSNVLKSIDVTAQ